jgi:hypothetical protein
MSFTLASEECGNLSREVLGKVSKLAVISFALNRNAAEVYILCCP